MSHSARGSILRPWEPADGQWYVDQLADVEIQRFTNEHLSTTPDAFREALVRLTAADDLFGHAVIDPDSGDLAGNMAARRDGDTACISYWIAKDRRGRGLARRGVVACCSWIEQTWPDITYAQLSIHPSNAASIRVAAATGFGRDPSRDNFVEIRGERRPMHAYVRRLRSSDDRTR